MQILLLLYLAHYLADYPFQTNWIYAQKVKSWQGGIFHTLTIVLALIVCLLPLLHVSQVWFAILGIAVVHYFQDAAKLIFNKTFEREVVGYFVDQILHIVFSTIFWFLFLKGTVLIPSFGFDYYMNPMLVAFLIGLILATYFVEVTVFVVGNANQLIKSKFKRNWKFIILNGAWYTFIWLVLTYVALR